MTTTDRAAATLPAPQASLRRTAFVAGVFYLLTFVSIPTLSLYAAVRGPDYVTGPGPDGPVVAGAFLEIIVALACIGTAVTLYPVVKRQNEGFAIGFVAVRALEAALIVAGIACLLSIVTLRQLGVGEDGVIAAQALVALHDWAFVLGQSLLPVVNALLLGSLLYRSRLVPRPLPVLGLIGAPLLAASVAATLLGLWEQGSPTAAVAALPIAIWEFSLGIYLVVRGFKPAPITSNP